MADPVKPGVRWDYLREFFASWGTLPVYHVGTSVSGFFLGILYWLWDSSPKILSVAILAFVLFSRGCTLPNFPWWTPTPSDPLVASFQAAYNKDTDADRASSLAYLQTIYKLMADTPPSPFPPSNRTAAAWLKGNVEKGLPDKTKAANLRHAIATELSSEFGTDGAALTNITLFTAGLRKVADALDKVH